jgi:hypothetical protein
MPGMIADSVESETAPSLLFLETPGRIQLVPQLPGVKAAIAFMIAA